MAGREASPPKDSNADAIASRQVPGRAKASRMAGRICSMSRVSANSIIPEKRRWLVFVYFAQTSGFDRPGNNVRSEEHTSELQSLMRISYAVFCLKKKIKNNQLIPIVTTNTKHMIQQFD